jgi:hypothetical protein
MTIPEYTIDGVDLTEAQAQEYSELLDDCAGDEDLCVDVWKLYHFSDGQQWHGLEAVQGLESDTAFMNELEGEEFPEVED